VTMCLARAPDWCGGVLPYKSPVRYSVQVKSLFLEELVLHQGSGNELEPRFPRAYTATNSAQLMSPYLDDSAAAAQSALETPLKAAPQLVAPEPGMQTFYLEVHSLS
jgi:hypothetical protein